jgi:hypothetical protein
MKQVSLVATVVLMLSAFCSGSYAGHAIDGPAYCSGGEGLAPLHTCGHCTGCTQPGIEQISHHFSYTTVPSNSEEAILETDDDRRCNSGNSGSTQFTISYSYTESYLSAHTWSGDATFTIVKDVLQLKAGYSHTNSSGWACSQGASVRVPIAFTSASGCLNHHKYHYNVTTYTSSGTTYDECVNGNTGHIVIHDSGSATMMKKMGYVDQTASTTVLDRTCTACGTANMTCNGHSCTHAGSCRCPHYPDN